MSFLVSSAMSKKTANGTSTSHVLPESGAVEKILFPKGWYTMKSCSSSSTAMPAKMSLLEKN
jgi:hypothetical protein